MITTTPTAADHIKACASGEQSVTDIAHALFEQIDSTDAKINAWAYLNRTQVLSDAKALDKGPPLPLRGMVFAAKDNIDTADMPTAYGSPIHLHKTPARDAACIAQLRLSGALLLGKTVSTEFAHVFPGKTCNPHNPEHTPGGSSSGSAAAVASAMVDVALGTQTTGSVIRPAAFCGVVGFKPTYGDVNLSGVLANAPSFDTLGWMSRSIADAALLHQTLVHTSHATFTPATISGLRVALAQTPWWDRADAQAQTSLQEAAEALEAMGARVKDYDSRILSTDLDAVSQRISGFEFAQTMAHERLYAIDQLSDALRNGRMRTGLDTSYEQYVTDKQTLEDLRRRLDDTFADIDVILSLPAAGAAPHGTHHTGDPIFNMPWTSLHAPAATLPLSKSTDGLPLGLQVIGKRYADDTLLSYAAGIERALS